MINAISNKFMTSTDDQRSRQATDILLTAFFGQSAVFTTAR
jgi:hypothetical protein